MIIPAIIPQSLDDLEKTLKATNFSREVQIDLVDGKFVENIGWPYEPTGEAKDVVSFIDEREVEVDLMVQDPLVAAKEWCEVGVKRIIFHLESLSQPEEAIRIARKHAVEVFFSINNDTKLDTLYPYIDQINGVQLMGIAEIGSQGQPFDSRVLDRAVMLHALYPDLVISVDGGVSRETIADLKKVGVQRFVSGSAILKSDNPEQTYKELLKIVS